MLLVWNLHLAIHNKTTIEFHEGVTAKIQVSADLAHRPLQALHAIPRNNIVPGHVAYSSQLGSPHGHLTPAE